jgi:hypothetical protein
VRPAGAGARVREGGLLGVLADAEAFVAHVDEGEEGAVEGKGAGLRQDGGLGVAEDEGWVEGLQDFERYDVVDGRDAVPGYVDGVVDLRRGRLGF